MSLAQMSVCLILAIAAPVHVLAATLVVITPHPDDAEASCGGLIANMTAAGDKTVILTLTGGELGIGGKRPEEARAIRTAEAKRAAAVLGAQAEFFGGIDGSLVADAAATARLTGILQRLRPDVVVAPWPLDVHPDHQSAGMLAWRAFQDRRLDFSLFFYETANAPHTTSFGFTPTDYVDVSNVMKLKQEATYQHASQNPAAWFDMYLNLARIRGYESDTPMAEGYVRARNSSGLGGRAARTGKNLQ